MTSLDANLHNTSIQIWLPRIISITLAALIAWWVIVYVLPMFAPVTSKAKTTAATPAVRAEANRSVSDLHLFGVPEKAVAVNRPSEAKETRLELTLRGILATEDPTQGYAQIQNASKEEKIFLVEQSIFGVAILKEIYIDRVIILYQNQYETLLLPEEFLNTEHFMSAKRKLERKKIATNYRDLFLTRNNKELLKLFGFDTAWKNGGFIGFIVRALGQKGREMMATLGVEDGDLITVVNGLRFSESLTASQQLAELKNATSVDVIIERNGEEIPFHFEFDPSISERIEAGTFNPDGADFPGATAATGTNPSSSPDTGGSGQFSSSTDEDLGEDWDESEAAEEFKLKQQERSTGISLPVEYDH